MKLKILLQVLLLSSAFSLSLCAQCSITNFTMEAECDINGIVNLEYQFDVEDPGDDNLFELYADGSYIGNFEYGQTTYSIGLSETGCTEAYTFEIVDQNDSDCSATYTFDDPFCCWPVDCNMSLEVESIGACNADGEFNINLLVTNPTGSGGGFETVINGVSFGFTDYGLSSYEFGPLDIECNAIYEIDAIDFADEDCIFTLTMENDVCCLNCDDFIVDYVGANTCTSSGTFFADILIDNPASVEFEIIIDGISDGIYQYGETEYSFGPFVGDCITEHTFEVIDLDNDCTSTIVLEPVCCPQYCSISDITVEAIECTGDGIYSIELDFEYNEVEETEFDVWANGIYHGTYAYADLPILISDFPVAIDQFITVFGIGADVLCSDDLDFEGFTECSTDCNITNVFAEAYNCNDQGQIFVDIEFEINNPGASNQFTINGNGTSYGTFEYGQTFYTVGPFTPDCDLDYEFVVTDIDNNDCTGFYGFNEALCCENDECTISGIEAEATCTDDELYLDVWFTNDNPGSSNQFTINVWGQEFGPFEYGESFYNIGPMELPCEPFQPITVVDFDDTDCSGFFELELVQGLCCDLFDCQMTTLDFGNSPICEDGLIVTNWFIDGENLSEVGYDIYINDVFETFVTWNEDASYNFDIEDPGTELFTLKVCDNDNEECCIEWELENPCYEADTEECSITGVEAEAICNDDGLFADIWFTYDNPGTSNQFTIDVNGQEFGPFEYGESFYNVGPIEFPCDQTQFINVTDVDNTECTGFFNLELLEDFCCEEECAINNLTVETSECNDGTDISLTFELVGGSGEVYISLNDDSFGPYDDLIFPLTYVSFSYETEYITVSVCDAEDLNCCATVEVLNPCYDPDGICAITTLDFGDNPECIDGLIVTEWLIDGENLSEQGFDIYIDNLYETSVDFNETNWYDFDIEDPGTELFTLKVCDNDNSDCCIEWDLDNPCYDPNTLECSISGLEAEAACTDDGLFLDVWFTNDNPGSSNQFTINVWGQEFGPFEYGESFYNIGPMELPCEPFQPITVVDFDDTDCSGFFELELVQGLCCDLFDCQMTTLDFGDNPICQDGLIVTNWLIDGENLSEVGFDIYINDEFETFVTWNEDALYDFDIDDPGTEFYTLKVCDNDNEECCIEWELDNPCYDAEECSIIDLGAESYDCNDDNEIYFDIFFEVNNPGVSNQFTVTGNGNNYGTFEYGLDSYQVGPITTDCETELEFIVTDVDDNDCSAFVGHDPICCEEEPECPLVELSLETSECFEDNTFNLTLDVEIVGDVNDFFDLNLNGVFDDFYEFNQLPLTIDNLSYDTEFITVELCENDNPDCCLTLEIENPCYQESNQQFFINNIEVEFISCEEDMIMMAVDLEHGDNNDQFSVTANGIEFGKYNYSDLPIMVENVPADGVTNYNFTIEDTNIDDLINSINVGVLACDGDLILDAEDVTLDPANIKSIEAYDVTGKRLGIFNSEESLKILDIDRSVSAGIMILRIDYGTQIVTKKVVRVN